MKKHFTENEIKEIWWEDNYIVMKIGQSRRWSQIVTLITEKDRKFYSVYFDQGLTENQEDVFYDQEAPEVELIDKTIVIEEWVKKEDGE